MSDTGSENTKPPLGTRLNELANPLLVHRSMVYLNELKETTRKASEALTDDPEVVPAMTDGILRLTIASLLSHTFPGDNEGTTLALNMLIGTGIQNTLYGSIRAKSVIGDLKHEQKTE